MALIGRNIQLEKWAAEKRVHNDLIYQDFHADLEIEMLADVAYELYKDDKIFFTKDELVFRISSFIDNTLNIGKRINCSKIIEAIEIHQGLLVQRASDIYSFSHLTIQEYLTSHYFFSKSKISELVDKHLFNPKWREVFLLLSGMSNTDTLTSQCTQKLLDHLKKHNEIAKYIKWSQKIVISTDNAEENLARRIFMLSFPLLYIRGISEENIYDISGRAHYEWFAIRITSHILPNFHFKHFLNLNKKRTIEILENLESLTFLKIDISPFIEIVRNETDKPIRGIPGSVNLQNRKFLNIILQCLGFDLNQYKPGYVKLKPLVDYLEACEFLLKIKETSLTISKEAWIKTCNNLVVYQ